MPRPKKVNNAFDELTEKNATMNVGKSNGGNGTKLAAKSKRKMTVRQRKTQNKTKVVLEAAKEIVKVVQKRGGDRRKKTADKKKRPNIVDYSSTDSKYSSSSSSCSCSVCEGEDSSFMSMSSDSSSGYSPRSSSDSRSSYGTNRKKSQNPLLENRTL